MGITKEKQAQYVERSGARQEDWGGQRMKKTKNGSGTIFMRVLNLNFTLRIWLRVNYFDSNFIIFPATFFDSIVWYKFPFPNVANKKGNKLLIPHWNWLHNFNYSFSIASFCHWTPAQPSIVSVTHGILLKSQHDILGARKQLMHQHIGFLQSKVRKSLPAKRSHGFFSHSSPVLLALPISMLWTQRCLLSSPNANDALHLHLACLLAAVEVVNAVMHSKQSKMALRMSRSSYFHFHAHTNHMQPCNAHNTERCASQCM